MFPNGPENFLVERRAALEARLFELRPAIAEVRRIGRSIKAIDAALGRQDRQETRSGLRRKRFPEAIRSDQILALLAEEPRTRRQLADELGLSQPRISQLVVPLIREDRVVQLAGSVLAISEDRR
jgi:predicted HTH transcriptional regulator